MVTAEANRKERSSRRDWVPILLTVGILGGLAHGWTSRFILDDAFISFRYARNLALGHGLVWNVGEWVEGYTNFLWTLLMSVPFFLGWDAILFSQCCGLIFLVLTLVAAYHVARIAASSRSAGLWTVLFLTTSSTFCAYGTSGLETSMQTGWLTMAAALMAYGWSNEKMGVKLGALISLLLACALMTRLDSAVIGVWIGLMALSVAYRTPDRKERARAIAALILPGAVLVGTWWVWKFAVYGDLLPNTYYAKASGGFKWNAGARYLWLFFTSTLLLPAPFIILIRGKSLLEPRHRIVLMATAAIISWCVYLLKVGGDFMEFRFMAPLLPLLFLAIAWLVCHPSIHRVARLGIALLVLLGAMHHRLTFETTDGIETIDDLESHLHRPVQDWIGVGKTLAEAFPPPSDVLLATTAAGAIPFYSALPTVDMLGLTDSWIAHHGNSFGAQLAHERIAPMSYLVERGVHLLLGQPWLRRPSPPQAGHYAFAALREFKVFGGVRAGEFPASASIIEIPLDPYRNLVALYLTPHPSVEKAILERGWRRFRIQAPAQDSVL